MSRDRASLMPNRQAALGFSGPQPKHREGKEFGSHKKETFAEEDLCGMDSCHLLAEDLTVNVRLADRACSDLTCWPEYNQEQEGRGGLTLWFDETAVAGWRADEESATTFPIRSAVREPSCEPIAHPIARSGSRTVLRFFLEVLDLSGAPAGTRPRV